MTEDTTRRWWAMPAIASVLTIGNVAVFVAAFYINGKNCAPYADANGRDMKFFHLMLSFLANAVGLGVAGSWWPAARERRNSHESRASNHIARWSALAGGLLVTLWTLRAVVDDPYC